MKNILLAVSGLSPQVITEALYALWHEGREVHAIQIITTRPGKERILAGLLAPDNGKFHALLNDYHRNPESIEFNGRSLHVLKDANGRELDDIITLEDNETLMRTCLEQAFCLTAEPGTAVFFLVAGGRKTMTSCLTLAAQLYGRPQDRIFHVLVSPEFESCRDFWFPPRESVLVEIKNEKGEPAFKETRYANISLITIPFFSVREQLRQDFFDEPRPPAELMHSLIRDEPQNLVVSLAESKLVLGRREMDLHPNLLAFYAFFAVRKKKCQKEGSCAGCSECFLDADQITGSSMEMAKLYQEIPGSRVVEEMSPSGISGSDFDRGNFQSSKSKIRKKLLQDFGHGLTAELEISSVGERGNTRYGIRLDRNRIRMEW